jgi:hypothetical protein
MTKYQIELDEHQMDLVEKTINAMISRAKRDTAHLFDVGLNLEYLKIAFDEAKANPIEQEKPKRKTKKEADYQPKLCPDHPTYTARRPPTIDCEGHWEAYKLMNPLKYERARAKFERNQKAT